MEIESTQTDELIYNIYTDGASRPSGSASAWVIVYNGVQIVVRAVKHNELLTNNEAEYTSIVMALECVPDGSNIIVHTDSQLVVNQVIGRYKVRAKNLRSLHHDVIRQCKNHLGVTFVWVPRIHPVISLCDSLCSGVLNESVSSKICQDVNTTK